MSKLLVATLVVSLLAPVAGLAVAQAVSGPPRTQSMAPTAIQPTVHGGAAIPAGQPHAFLAPQDGVAQSAAVLELRRTHPIGR